MKLPHIISKVYCEPWAITLAKHRAIQAAVEAHLAGQRADMMNDDDGDEDDYDGFLDENGTAVIPVFGILGKHLSGLEMMCGGCDVDQVARAIDEVAGNANVRRLAFAFHSPGGTITGIPELAAKVAAIEKPSFAFSDGEMCSAAYWLASQCDAVYSTPSAAVGSIGVWCAYVDASRQLENDGVKVNEFFAGKFKTMGASWRPMTKAEAAMIQAAVDKSYERFKGAILTARPDISDDDMQGQIFDGEAAASKGLTDGTVDDMADFLDVVARALG